MIQSSLDSSGVVVFRCTGSLEVADILQAIETAYGSTSDNPRTMALWDTQDAEFEWTLEDVSLDAYADVVDRANKYQNEIRIAIVVNSDLSRALIELSKKAIGFELSVGVFDDYSVAYAWLT